MCALVFPQKYSITYQSVACSVQSVTLYYFLSLPFNWFSGYATNLISYWNLTLHILYIMMHRVKLEASELFLKFTGNHTNYVTA